MFIKRVRTEPPRHTIETLEEGIRITLPRRKSLWKTLWLGFMLLYSTLFVVIPAALFIGLALGLSSTEYEDLSRVLSFLLPIGLAFALFLGFSVFFMLSLIYQLLWQLDGREIIEVGPNVLSITKQIFAWRQTTEYAQGSITDLRVSALPERFANPIFALLKRDGVIGLDYGAKTYRFGLDIDEAEAQMIIAALKPYLPNLNKN